MILGILFLFQKEENLLDADGFTKKKFGLDGKVDKHKALLVAKGFSQVEGIDY